jgi:hypothetical protein
MYRKGRPRRPEASGRGLEAAFRDHLGETELHLTRIESLLEERGAGPSLVKDAMLKAGGLTLSALFAVQSDSPPGWPASRSSSSTSRSALRTSAAGCCSGRR